MFVFVLQDSIGLLLDAVKTSNEDLAQTWKKSEQWATIEQLCSKSLLIRVTYSGLRFIWTDLCSVCAQMSLFCRAETVSG